jgi:3-oxoacyl-[acyl-carrier protein] reductase
MSKIAFISGASRGIGRSTALSFAKAGYRLAITARELGSVTTQPNKALSTSEVSGSLKETARMIEELGADVIAIKMDLLSSDSVDAAIDQVIKHFGTIDVVINNAIYQGAGLNASLSDLTQETLERVARAYICAPVQITQAVLPSMLKQKSGCIINITSGAGETDPPIPASRGGWGYAYGAGKAAVSRLSGIISREHGHQGIRAFTVNPGVVNTETLRATIGDQGIKGLKKSVAEPEVIADVLLWIAENPSADAMQYTTIQAQALARDLKEKK